MTDEQLNKLLETDARIQFVDPHPSGGISVTTLTARQAVEFTRKIHDHDYKNDIDALDEFMVVNWATVVTDGPKPTEVVTNKGASMKNRNIWETIGYIVFLAVALYISFAWMWFSIIHPKAGSGAIYVHFHEVITFGQIPELQESGEP